MDNLHPAIVYQIIIDRHRENVARGEAAQRLDDALGARPVRTRLAGALATLARHLDPAPRTARPDGAELAPSAPA